MTEFHFTSGQEMLAALQQGIDLYSPEQELYVFLYSESGSIASYHITQEEAQALTALSQPTGEAWSAYLGFGGDIYDDPSSEFYEPGMMSNGEYCNIVWDNIWNAVAPCEE